MLSPLLNADVVAVVVAVDCDNVFSNGVAVAGTAVVDGGGVAVVAAGVVVVAAGDGAAIPTVVDADAGQQQLLQQRLLRRLVDALRR